MRSLQIVVLLIVLNASLPGFAQTQPKKGSRDLTLNDVRAILVGKTVVVIGRTSQSPILKGYLLDWKPAALNGKEYKENSSDYVHPYLSESYRDKEAEVIAVQLNSLEKERTGVGGVNALGEVTSDASIVNPYCDVVVKFLDGTIAMTTSYPSLILSDSVLTRPFRLLAERMDRAALITSQLSSIVGRPVYAVAYSRLYLPTSLESLMETSRYSAQQTLEFPRLEPLTILVAKYDEGKDVIILKLKDGKGREYLTLSHFQSHDDKSSFLEKVVGSYPASLHSSMPELTSRELEAVRKGSIFTGMSKSALYYTIGFPEKENDWGLGGKQLIYLSGKLYVYLDASKHVKDWQSLNR